MSRDKDSLGERFYSLREDSSLSMAKFGSSIGVSAGYINDIEKGVKSNVSDTVVLLTSYVYSVNKEWLLTGEGERNYCSSIQKFNANNTEMKPSVEGNRMIGIQIIEIMKIMTRLQVRVENLESQIQEKQKKNPSTSS